MKKDQNGISIGKLILIVFGAIILIATILLTPEEEDFEKEFANFVSEIASVKKAFLSEGVVHLMSEDANANTEISESQAYNYLAKGGTTKLIPDKEKESAWLTKAQADAIPCTMIEKDVSKQAIGIYLPKREVKTYKSKATEVSYFITNKGDIFIWPPYYREKDGLFYINDNMVVKGSKVSSGDWTITSGDEAEMYKDGFAFMVNGVEIKILATGEDVLKITPDTPLEEIANMASIAYKDKRNAKAPRGTPNR